MSAYKLWDIAIGVDTKPVTRLDPTNARQQIVPNVDEILAWIRRDANAMCSIVCNVSDSIMALIQHVAKSESETIENFITRMKSLSIR